MNGDSPLSRRDFLRKTSALGAAAAVGPQLRIFGDDNSPLLPARPPLSPQMTLREFYQHYFSPLCLATRDAKTVVAYNESVEWWLMLTGDPPLNRIDEFTTTRFVTQLREQPGRKSPTLSTYTVRKHCRQLQAVFTRTGPRSSSNRQGQGVLDNPPIIEACRVDQKPPERDYTVAEIEAMIRAAGVATQPRLRDCEPYMWWQSFLQVAYYTGLRRGALLGIEFSQLSSEDGDLLVPAGISKRGRGQRIWLLPEARLAIDAIRGQRRLIFEWDGHVRSVHRQLMKIIKAAGLPKERRFGFHGIRSTHSTVLAEVSDLASTLSLGHSGANTTQRHYINHQKIIRKALELMPRLRVREGRQKRLF